MDPYAGMTPDEIRREREVDDALMRELIHAWPEFEMENGKGASLDEAPITFKKKKRKKKRLFRP